MSSIEFAHTGRFLFLPTVQQRRDRDRVSKELLRTPRWATAFGRCGGRSIRIGPGFRHHRKHQGESARRQSSKAVKRGRAAKMVADVTCEHHAERGAYSDAAAHDALRQIEMAGSARHIGN